MSFHTLTAEERLNSFKEFAQDATKTKALGDASLTSYVSNLKGLDKNPVLSSLLNGRSVFEIVDVQIIQTLIDAIHEEQAKYESSDSHHTRCRDIGSHLLKYQEFVKYYIKDLNPQPEMPASSKASFSIGEIIAKIKSTGLIYSDALIKRYAFALMTKPFVVLSGLAGSGKTQLSIAFATALCDDIEKQMQFVAVGADWTNREPLLGYPNALDETQYVQTENCAIDIIMRATEDPKHPYFLILDEMNLSYVERYFADFLSAMESDKPIKLWKGNGSVPKEIKLPSNLYIIGTINVDETTYMFSPKVLDRSSVIEFKVNHDEIDTYLTNRKPVNMDNAKPQASGMGEAFVELSTKEPALSSINPKNTLVSFFDELKKVNAEFGFRTANEIYRFIAISAAYDDTQKVISEDVILDAAIIQKLLPKLHGSQKKLKDVLGALWKLCFEKNAKELAVSTTEDLLSSNLKYPLTADKILRMYQCAIDNGFTSFAEA